MTVVRADDLVKRYGELTALDGLSLAVEAGELFGFLGPNGAGKTTTLEVLTGQLRPDGGEVSVLGTDPATEPIATRRVVGVLPEQGRPPSFLTPREFAEFVGTVRDLDDDTVADRLATWAERLGYTEKLDTLCTDLSRGQQQKVMVTAAFLHEPRVAFIDEPLANLDPIVQERLKRFLRSYVADGNTVFLSTHHIEVAADLCTRVGIVDRGRLIAERVGDEVGSGEDLLATFLEQVGDDEAGSERAADLADVGRAEGTASDGPAARDVEGTAE
ncbi:MAG: ABC transporter ATP-binding protein [Halobacteriaceae archaeon]